MELDFTSQSPVECARCLESQMGPPGEAVENNSTAACGLGPLC
jgi:hypothetical protein